MPDMLVKLYDLPGLEAELARQQSRSIAIHHALAPDKQSVLKWVKRHWGRGWASECDVAFARQPVACILATRAGKDPDADNILGFACYESTCRGFFGPTGVLPAEQGAGIGQTLLLATLHAMRAQGHAYAIIGGVGADVQGFYAKAVGAVVIEGSDPGVYGGML
jgi:GNAT superfamily N-acetyltransferase